MSIIKRLFNLFRSSSHRILDKIETVEHKIKLALIKQDEVIEKLTQSSLILGTTLAEQETLVQEKDLNINVIEKRIKVILTTLETADLTDEQREQFNLNALEQAENLSHEISIRDTFASSVNSLDPKVKAMYSRIDEEKVNKRKLQADLRSLQAQYKVAEASLKAAEVSGTATIDGIRSIVDDIQDRVRLISSEATSVERLNAASSNQTDASRSVDRTLSQISAQEHLDRIRSNLNTSD